MIEGSRIRRVGVIMFVDRSRDRIEMVLESLRPLPNVGSAEIVAARHFREGSYVRLLIISRKFVLGAVVNSVDTNSLKLGFDTTCGMCTSRFC